MTMRLVLCALLLLLLARAEAAAPPAEADSNPRPAEGDLLLKLPCGTSLALRRVATPVADSPLADRRVLLGDEQADAAYSEFVRSDYVVGDFGHGTDAHMWLGKYEVTRGQYVAVTAGCDAYKALPEAARRLPQAGVTWTDALRFAEQATEAVLRLDRDALPAEGEARAFVRLPTEAEWEYAARGGAAVTDAEFRQRLPPLPGPVTTVAQLRRVGSRPTPQPVGLLQPDRLGLYDMLGNVSEMVGDPYRATRGGRAGGRAGGIVARGGDVSIAPDVIRTSQRTEYAPFRSDGTRLAAATLGFRVALGLPLVTDLGTDQALRRAWDSEQARAGEALDPNADPRALAQKLEADIADPAQKKAVGALRGAVETERAKRVQSDERAVRSAIGAGAVLIRSLRNDSRVMAGWDRTVALMTQQAEKADAARLKDAQAQAAIWRRSRTTTFAALSSLILQQTEPELLPETLAAQLAVWRAENDSADFATLRDFAGRFVTEVDKARPARAVDHDAVLKRLLPEPEFDGAR